MTSTQLQRYRALVEIVGVLARTRSTEEVVRAVHEQTGRLISAPITLLATRDADGGWRCRALEDDLNFEARLPPRPDGLLERAIEGRLGIVHDVPEFLHENRLAARRLRQTDTTPITRSWIGAPLHVEGNAIGVLSLQSYTPAAFEQADLEFLRVLAQHVSIAMENAALRERLEWAALVDELTGLPNRRAFNEQAPRAITRAREHGTPLCLAVLDVQQFKRINDDCGHAAGDAVLAELGRRLRSDLRTEDTAFRLGGDEFAALLWTDGREGRGVMTRLGVRFETAAWPPCVDRVRVNVGVAELQAGFDLSHWLHEADEAMYAAKGRGAVV